MNARERHWRIAPVVGGIAIIDANTNETVATLLRSQAGDDAKAIMTALHDYPAESAREERGEYEAAAVAHAEAEMELGLAVCNMASQDELDRLERARERAWQRFSAARSKRVVLVRADGEGR